MKKILYLHAGAELYGADIVLLELLKNLDKKKFKPYVILPCDGPLVEKLKENNIWVNVIKYPILRRKYFNPSGIIRYIKEYYRYSKQINEIVRKEKINLIHTNTAAVLEGIYIKKRMNIKLIWHIHEIIVNPKFINKAISFLISRYADKVITVSEAVKRHLDSTGYFNNNEIKVIYNGVDNNEFKPDNRYDYIKEEFDIPNNAKIVGMIGRVNAWKGQQDFLNAIEITLDKYSNVYCMMVGGVFEGEEWRMKELEERISKMKNKDRIILSDYRNDTKNIHSLYDVFVLPSINPDPLPTVVLEAMASGTPIVGYRHGGICEMVKENYNGLLATATSYKELAKCINELIEDKQKCEIYRKNSLFRQKEKFSIKSYISNFEEVYNIK